MLKHIVMWKLKEEAEGLTKAGNAAWMKENLERLTGIVPELRSLEVGIPLNPEESGFDAILVSTFEDLDALERYKIHPEHVKISNYCKKIRLNRVAVDYIV